MNSIADLFVSASNQQYGTCPNSCSVGYVSPYCNCKAEESDSGSGLDFNTLLLLAAGAAAAAFALLYQAVLANGRSFTFTDVGQFIRKG